MSDYRKVVYTADYEEPKCMRCDYISGGFECCESCGPEHGWYGYNRTEIEEVAKLQNNKNK